MTNNLCPHYSIFDFFNNKNFFWPIWTGMFSMNILIFCYCYMITNFRFRIFIIAFDTIIYLRDLTSIGLIFIVLWYLFLYMLSISNLSLYAFVDNADTAEHMNLSASTDFPSLCIDKIPMCWIYFYIVVL